MFFISRGNRPYVVTLQFNNSSSTNPGVALFTCECESGVRPFYYVYGGGSLSLYYQKEEAYGSLALLSLRTNSAYMSDTKITLQNSFTTSLSSSAVQASFPSKYVSTLYGNVNSSGTGYTVWGAVAN